jgi:L-asparaginase
MQVSAKKIVVLGTGGTIAGRAASAQDNVGYRAGEVGVGDLLAGLSIEAGITLHPEQVAQIDSKDMDFAVWHALAQRCAHWLAQPDVAGTVITHGTDTMEETAFFLQSVLAPVKPVVLTGAMRPASSIAPDGPQNLADAIAVASSQDARGVCVVFAGRVHGPHDVQKVHPYRLDAFSSGDAGPLAVVEEGAVRSFRAWPTGTAMDKPADLPEPAHWARVEIVLSHAGASGAAVEALVRQGVAGLVVAATGNGTVHYALEEALRAAQQRGVQVRRASRCIEGRVLPHSPGSIPVTDLSPVKARIALMLELMR